MLESIGWGGPMLRTHSTSAHVNAPDAGVRKTAVRAAANTYMTTTSARYCNHTPPRTTPGPGEATMGRDCLVEAGKGSRNASERPGEGFLPPDGNTGSGTLTHCRGPKSHSTPINGQLNCQLLERASSIILESLREDTQASPLKVNARRSPAQQA